MNRKEFKSGLISVDVCENTEEDTAGSCISATYSQNPLRTFPRNFTSPVDGEVANLLRAC